MGCAGELVLTGRALIRLGCSHIELAVYLELVRLKTP